MPGSARPCPPLATARQSLTAQHVARTGAPVLAPDKGTGDKEPRPASPWRRDTTEPAWKGPPEPPKHRTAHPCAGTARPDTRGGHTPSARSGESRAGRSLFRAHRPHLRALAGSGRAQQHGADAVADPRGRGLPAATPGLRARSHGRHRLRARPAPRGRGQRRVGGAMQMSYVHSKTNP